MKRRTLLGAGLGVATVAAAPATAQETLSLSLITDRPQAAAGIAARIAAMSDGRITIDVQTAGADSAASFLDTVSGGAVDIYLTSQDAFVARNPAFGLFSAHPGGMSTSELESWIIVSDGRFMWDLLGDEFGIKSFMAGDEGAMPLWSRAPITSLDDLKSGPVGSTGLGLQLLKEMGVTEVVDVMSASDLGSLVALEGLNAAQMVASGLAATFPHMTTPNAARPSAALSLGINMQRWTGLSEADQLLIERCIMAEHGVHRALALHENALALNNEAAGIVPHEMPQDIWDAQIAAANVVMASMFDAGDIAADTADAYLYFISDVAEWSEIGETAYFLGRKEALSQ
ncbi:hypothetical protein [Sulfitobacter donghicola]|uniref:ABC transporter substrate-binding protein n=1 Tax=Sulfitobacter donghicola DSW-25 = KCTC 12864 = JCM 14565 TaxID=1300350 RepID=A0A073IDN4_9RHOB|nr:hypothetical protein [Sulfitobacter donghicola]KEJ87854.1 hypothetical protein DSW25_04760 [Sulfitobacter donghicola DSW-25 = KCTC 12864 = JCM 14565]KIN60006.1 Bacterial ABC superfamily ATP binding cassette transporter, binding protein, family 7 [Sulfitobacter donghicola DSW-25 = KCTC 12864 = JCM 14565]